MMNADSGRSAATDSGELEREMEYFVEPEEAFTRDEIE